MQTATTFLEAGWDFAGEWENGTENIWWIDEGQDYPRLWREGYPWAKILSPPNGATEVVNSPSLSWYSGEGSQGHDIYFGKYAVEVATATVDTVGVYRGRQAAGITSYRPGLLELDTTYCWRIDEVNEANSSDLWQSAVWHFTTVDHIIVVDDFEGYSWDIEEGLHLIQTWLPGAFNGTGSSFYDTEKVNVHDGRQSISIVYYNVHSPFYSEAERTWQTPQDWIIEGADTLTLYFMGAVDNVPEPLYVTIEDSAGNIAAVMHSDENALLATDWQKWHIALADLHAAGVDVASVKKIYIGIGNRDDPSPGGTGWLYVDDIQLTKRML